MNQSAIAVGLFLALSAVVYVLIEIGRQTGNRQAIKDEEGARIGLGAVEGALFGLMGLLMAFTFSGAASRFDTRRQLILQEANAIGTAWLRLDLLKPATREPLRQLFRDYLEARIWWFSHWIQSNHGRTAKPGRPGFNRRFGSWPFRPLARQQTSRLRCSCFLR